MKSFLKNVVSKLTSSSSKQGYSQIESDSVPDSSERTQSLSSHERPSSLRVFTYKELETATENFNYSNRIGESRYYKGTIESSKSPSKRVEVAIKQLNESEYQKDWISNTNVLDVLGQAEHNHLVKLLGYGTENGQFLVYEYVPNGSVRSHLSANSGMHPSWATRLKIARDVACGLVHLHEGMDSKVIVGEFKSSNILLDKQWNAKITYYGLANMLNPEKAQAFALALQYRSYSYALTGRFALEDDVRSYGVFLYELITGGMPVDENHLERERFPMRWIKPYLSDSTKFVEIVDPRLQGNFFLSAYKLSRVAEHCLVKRNSRHKMSEILKAVSELFRSDSSERNQSPSSPEKPSSSLRVFTYKELETTTKNFNDSNRIGECRYETVYKGTIKMSKRPSNRVDVVIKQLDESKYQKDWISTTNVLDVLGLAEHDNLLKLLGYCTEKGQFLVYEYMPNGSVKSHLSANSEMPLSWATRLKIARDVACGLVYLHEGMDFQVIFGEFKSSNILLDKQWNAKLTHYGLANMLNQERAVVLGPELQYHSDSYLLTGRPTFKSDVWSYGVFLYELITGISPCDESRPKGKHFLLRWIKPYLSDPTKFQEIIDPRLEGNFSLSANNLSRVADRCLLNRDSRPKMREILRAVNEVVENSIGRRNI